MLKEVLKSLIGPQNYSQKNGGSLECDRDADSGPKANESPQENENKCCEQRTVERKIYFF